MSFLIMHTDNLLLSLLGSVDCYSFYKWIPLSRWSVANSEVLVHFIYSALPSLPVFPSNTRSSHHFVFIYV